MMCSGCYPCNRDHETIGIELGGANKLSKKTVVFFLDFHLGNEETVDIAGEEFRITQSLEPMYNRLLEIQPDTIIVGTSKKPHPDLGDRIRDLKTFCEGHSIELDLSADELYFIRGGTVNFKGTSDTKEK
jgi:hypothetical protein